MKKILATLIGIAAGASFVHAQGYIEFTATGSSAGVTTNTAASASAYSAAPGNYATGKILGSATTPNAYDFELLEWTGGATVDSAATDPDWVAVTVDNTGALIFGTDSVLAGTFSGAGGVAGVEINLPASVAAPVMLVGWSANLTPSISTTSWGTIQGELTSGNWSVNGFFGNTAVGSVTPYTAPGSGDPTVITGMFPNNSLTMYAVSSAPVPEPATLALAGLGGISMLFLRRRKS